MNRTILLVTFAVLVVVGVFVYQQNRIDTLERQVDTLQSEVSSRPAMGDMIVVGKEINALVGNVGEACVRYRAFGSVEETCIPATTDDAVAVAMACYSAARVGSSLPDVCH